MRIAVFGATGRTGHHVVEQALGRGHTVTAVVRDAARFRHTKHDELEVTTTDILDAGTLAPAFAEQDAVVSAIGPGEKGPTSVCADTIDVIIDAMAKADLDRLVVVSAAGMHTDGDGPFTKTVVKPILRRVLRHGFADMTAMEDKVFSSGVDWTIVRPPMLTDRPFTGRYRRAVGRNVRGGNRIPRADLAHAILDSVEDDTASHTTWAVAT